MGTLTLTPEFNPAITEYTATTTNSTNKITATAKNENATVVIESDDATIASDGTATWVTGDNVVTITVTVEDGADVVEKKYTVTVTKS